MEQGEAPNVWCNILSTVYTSNMTIGEGGNEPLLPDMNCRNFATETKVRS